jgi:ribulose-5-phosphate 4-epimerase/fuculose-1-phosphate aldolase
MQVVRKQPMSNAEWSARCDLALCYRLVAHYGLTDLIYTHISARVPGAREQFLINPFGLRWDEITASSLVKIDLAGKPVESTAQEVNEAGFTIHSAIHMAREDAGCVIHLHSRASMAVAALAEELLPLNQISMQFYNRVAYHDYEGVSLDLDERPRIAASLGRHNAMILRNHGTIALGRSAGEAFSRAYYLEKSCELQLDAMATHGKLVLPPPEVCEHAARQWDDACNDKDVQREWDAQRRLIDKVNPGYDQ